MDGLLFDTALALGGGVVNNANGSGDSAGASNSDTGNAIGTTRDAYDPDADLELHLPSLSDVWSRAATAVGQARVSAVTAVGQVRVSAATAVGQARVSAVTAAREVAAVGRLDVAAGRLATATRMAMGGVSATSYDLDVVDEDDAIEVEEEERAVEEKAQLVHEEAQLVHEKAQLVHEEAQLVHEKAQLVHEEAQLVEDQEEVQLVLEESTTNKRTVENAAHDKVEHETAMQMTSRASTDTLPPTLVAGDGIVITAVAPAILSTQGDTVVETDRTYAAEPKQADPIPITHVETVVDESLSSMDAAPMPTAVDGTKSAMNHKDVENHMLAIQTLTATISQLHTAAAQSEESHRLELLHLHNLLATAELHLQELRESSMEHSAPLLARIGALQEEVAAARRERAIAERTCAMRVAAVERERDGEIARVERECEVRIREAEVRARDAQVEMERWRSEGEDGLAKIEDARRRMELAEGECRRLADELEEVQRGRDEEIEQAVVARVQSITEGLAERKWLLDERERALRDRERLNASQLLASNTDQTPSLPSPSLPPQSPRLASQSHQSDHSSRARIAQLESQLAALADQLHAMTVARDSYAEELVRFTTGGADIVHATATSTNEASATPTVSNPHEMTAEADSRLATALELLGEKTERVAELELDIQEMRDAYRGQVAELVDQLAAAARR